MSHMSDATADIARAGGGSGDGAVVAVKKE